MAAPCANSKLSCKCGKSHAPRGSEMRSNHITIPGLKDHRGQGAWDIQPQPPHSPGIATSACPLETSQLSHSSDICPRPPLPSHAGTTGTPHGWARDTDTATPPLLVCRHRAPARRAPLRGGRANKSHALAPRLRLHPGAIRMGTESSRRLREPRLLAGEPREGWLSRAEPAAQPQPAFPRWHSPSPGPGHVPSPCPAPRSPPRDPDLPDSPSGSPGVGAGGITPGFG